MAPGLRGNCDLPRDELKLCRYAHHLPLHPTPPQPLPPPPANLLISSVLFMSAPLRGPDVSRERWRLKRVSCFGQYGSASLLKASQSYCVISRFIPFASPTPPTPATHPPAWIRFCFEWDRYRPLYAVFLISFFFFRSSDLKFTLAYQRGQQGRLYAVLSSLITDILLHL